MSSSFKNFKIKAFRKSKDVELVNTVQEQETPAPGKKKISAKARKMAARLVPAALGKLSHPDCCHAHVVIRFGLRHLIRVLRVLYVHHHTMHK